MAKHKQEVRHRFRSSVFSRDKYRCKVCGRQWRAKDADPKLQRIDAHHITDRNLMPNVGYVPENGITVCQNPCHRQVEQFHLTGIAMPGLHPEDLYPLVHSSLSQAERASEKLSPP